MDLITMVLACSLYPDKSIPYAMAQVGSQNKPYVVKVLDTNTITEFPTEAKASSYANAQLLAGRSIEAGLMQIPSYWITQNHLNTAELFRPCKNMVIATHILIQAQEQCAGQSNSDTKACALSVYKTGDATKGIDYANTVISYAEQNPFASLEAKAHDPAMVAALSKTTKFNKPAPGAEAANSDTSTDKTDDAKPNANASEPQINQ